MKKAGLMMIATLVVLMVFSATVCAAAAEDYVGRDLDLKDGEMGIVSVGDDIDYVGKDLDLKDGEMGIVSVGDDIDYVGRDLDLKDGEAGIISIEDGDDEEGTSPYVYGGAVLLVAAAGGVALRFRK